MNVPFVDIRGQHEELRPEIEAAIKDIIDRSSFIGGEAVSRFEQDFAAYLGCMEVVGVANGTDALWLALQALGVGPGDGVITAPNTFIATVEAIQRVGASPLFVDIDLPTATIDVSAVARFLGESCREQAGGRIVHVETGLHVAAIRRLRVAGKSRSEKLRNPCRPALRRRYTVAASCFGCSEDGL